MTDLELAKQTFSAQSLAFVLVKQGVILRTGTRDGIGELIEATDSLGAQAQGAALADRIVGKAVAMVARASRMAAVYSPLMSEAARDALNKGHILAECDRLVPTILNKRNDGPCPMERLTQSIEEPLDAVDALREFARHRTQP